MVDRARRQAPEVRLSSGHTVPQLGFGWDRPDDDEAERAVGKALATGYRLVDTAAYYRNEVGIGRAIAASGLRRSELRVSTKLWNGDHGREGPRRSLSESLERLGLDYVDLYLMHWPCPTRDEYVETWRAFEGLASEGLIRSIGVANFEREHLERLAHECETKPVLNQIELHPAFQQRPLVEYHRGAGIETEAWRPLALGAVLEDPKVVRIAERLGRTPAQVVLRWHLDRGNIVIPKSGTDSRIVANFDVFDFELPPEATAEIDGIDAEGGRIGPHPNEFEAVTDAEVEALIAGVDPKRPQLS
jgi:2,5-diketo-D-gluconate reductase A